MTPFDPNILLDHMVINARVSMDEAHDVFRALGFTMTPRGHHTLGSINNLMMFRSDYLELLGMPPDKPDARPELAAAPMTINGLVFKTTDVDRTFARLQTLGFDGDPPKSFSRPVGIDGNTEDAAFSTVTVRDDVFSGGRVYFCEHRTPQFLWRDECMRHDNGVTGTGEFIVAATDVTAEAGRYAAMLERDAVENADGDWTLDLGGATLRVMSESTYRARFGELALDTGTGPGIFGALSFRCDSLDAVSAIAAAPPAGCRARTAGDAVQIRVDPFGTVLEFTT